MRRLARLLRWRQSVGTKLTLSFAGLSLVAVTVVAALLTTHSNLFAIQGLRDKATRYARLLEPQLRPVVAFNDRLTAHEVFEAFAADDEVDGLAIYNEAGGSLTGVGRYPDTLPHLDGSWVPGAARIAVLVPVVSPEGPRGHLYVSLTTGRVNQYVQRSTLTAAATALVALLLSVAVGVLLARAVAQRVRVMAAAAARVAAGDFDQPVIAAGAPDEIGQLARAFNVMVAELRRQFAAREELAVTEQARLEALVGKRTRQLEESREQYRLIVESTKAVPFTYAPEPDRFLYVGPQAEALVGFTPEAWQQPGFLSRLVPHEGVLAAWSALRSPDTGGDFEFECAALALDGRVLQLRWVVTRGEQNGERCLRGMILDITEQRRLERELAHAQKLESVGRLAAGVAHEINTPVQFVSDSTHFLKEASADLLAVVGALQEVKRVAAQGEPVDWAIARATDAEEAADLEYLAEQVPKAFDRCLDGLDRVTAIVRSMKEFAHPDSKDMASVDLNRAVASTLTIARNEYKYVADLVTDFGELPQVTCHVGDVNQAILNMVVNAAHAIGDVVQGTDRRGSITVRTRLEGDHAVISIADTGGGIPAHVASRIFDPFFTTKEVGKGTGQGLSIARQVIVDMHHGELRFETSAEGTTFVVRLPISPRELSTAPPIRLAS